uniref:Uncharacterized protein n=1 Tax=Utricularia reniformis TaxID=192314 RepID=A0A1Y0AZB9_9LAMI|nr:hypothetical protein AEK19_MT0198 [Utricularia reniformis]ART30478.1 hypothetical protein AEK19_MT0198 [Utricularia reniformis]
MSFCLSALVVGVGRSPALKVSMLAPSLRHCNYVPPIYYDFVRTYFKRIASQLTSTLA